MQDPLGARPKKLAMNEASLRILVLAEFANPNWISVPLVGYQHAKALADLHQVTLVTRAHNLQDIAEHPNHFRAVNGLDLGFWDVLLGLCFKYLFRDDFSSQAFTAFRIPFYFLFERRVWREYRQALKKGDFDVVLRLTPVSPVVPSPMATWLKKHTRIPFVLGPINGGLPWPKGYKQAQRQKEWVSGLRDLYRYAPYSASTYKHAAAVVVGSSQTWNEHVDIADRLFFVPENGIDERLALPREASAEHRLLQLIFVGRLVPFKACDIALKAAAPLLKAGLAHFTVVGFGEDRERLQALCAVLQIDTAVTFTGELPHAEAMNRLRSADVLVFPSIREFGGGVVFEALACGAVPLVSDYGGPGDVVEPAFGFRIPQSDEQTSIAAFGQVLSSLEKDRALLQRLSQNGQQFARDSLSWKGKALAMSAILRWCLGRGPRPAFAPPTRQAI